MTAPPSLVGDLSSFLLSSGVFPSGFSHIRATASSFAAVEWLSKR